jgi:hypothetical protein
MACAWNYRTHEPPSQLNSWPGPKAVLGRRLFRQGLVSGFATDLGFKEIYVDARAGYIMAARGAGDAAGPAPSHQPSESGK